MTNERFDPSNIGQQMVTALPPRRDAGAIPARFFLAGRGCRGIWIKDTIGQAKRPALPGGNGRMMPLNATLATNSIALGIGLSAASGTWAAILLRHTLLLPLLSHQRATAQGRLSEVRTLALVE
jgi:hypothetical protein